MDESAETVRKLGHAHRAAVRPADRDECDIVNAAILLRRPLLVTGSPGSGKSSLAFRISRELGLGRVLQWPITSRSTLRSGLYEYDAIGRAQAAATVRASRADGPEAAEDVASGYEITIGDFLRLGPVGTALLAYELPRVLLIDELDQSNVDLPIDLLHIFEDGEFAIPELVRVKSRTSQVTVFTDDPGRMAVVFDGLVRCRAFPIVVITSNGEREFPPAFLRRCLRLEIQQPNADELVAMVRAHFPDLTEDQRRLVDEFLSRGPDDVLARDQLLNAVFLTTSGVYGDDMSRLAALIDAIWHRLAAEG